MNACALARLGAVMTAIALTSISLMMSIGIAKANDTRSAPDASTERAIDGEAFTLGDYSIDNGGGRTSGGVFSIDGTIGQPDANAVPSSGGAFEVSGGFPPAPGAPPPGDALFANSFENP